jgi:hypothetical protein
MNIWLSRREAARKISVSGDTIERRAIPWQDEPVPGKIRWQFLKLGQNTWRDRRYFEPDIEAFLEPK